MSHPYIEFEKTPLWKAMDAAVAEMEQNRDVELRTTREHFIGYLCQQLSAQDIVTESMDTATGITAEELAAMKARIEATTPGPWVSFFEGRDHCSGDSFIQAGTQDIYITADDYAGGGGHFCADQDFIANARQDMSRLIAEIERLHKLVKK